MSKEIRQSKNAEAFFAECIIYSKLFPEEQPSVVVDGKNVSTTFTGEADTVTYYMQSYSESDAARIGTDLDKIMDLCPARMESHG